MMRIKPILFFVFGVLTQGVTEVLAQDTGSRKDNQAKGHSRFGEDTTALQGVVVLSKKKVKYSNRNNPAVELIRQVIAHKEENRMPDYETSGYEQYEKLQVSLGNLPEKLKTSKLTRQFDFMWKDADTQSLPGKTLYAVYMEEVLSQQYLSKHPNRQKKLITAHKKVDFGEYIDTKGVSQLLNRLYEDVNIYDNNISLFTNQFVSPVSSLSPALYMFFLRDTVNIDGVRAVKLFFMPRNPDDMLFRGTLYITLDGRYAVKQLQMGVSKHINLNFVHGLNIEQTYRQDTAGKYYLEKTHMLAEMGLSSKGMSLVGQRTVSVKDFVANPRLADSVFAGGSVEERILTNNSGQDYLATHRHDTLSGSEAAAYTHVERLEKMPAFRRMGDYLALITMGYKSFGPVEMGPVATFYTFNPVEGFKLRAGGRTTTHFSKRYYVESYAAYGFKDEKWKYYLGTTYSLNNKSVYSFPAQYIRASYQHDTKIPGQSDDFVQENSFLLSFKRGNNDKWLYNDIARIKYVYEMESHLSIEAGVKYWKQSPAGVLNWIKAEDTGHTDSIQQLTTGEASLGIRWAPHEQFYESKGYRTSIVNKYPILSLRFTAGMKGFLGGQYRYQVLNFYMFKRFYLSPIGYTDVSVDAGYQFGTVPYPLLNIHRANQTYAYLTESYNMMNNLEFVSDHYVGINADHYFNGFFFNKIPLLKKLKWREVIAGKVLYGGLRKENNPAYNSSQMLFQTENGSPVTYSLDGRPYMEVSAGIANIFKFLRVDYVKRLTYLEHPGIADWGIRARLKFDF